jgi:hypothetical protein
VDGVSSTHGNDKTYVQNACHKNRRNCVGLSNLQGRIILKNIIEEAVQVGLIWLRKGSVAGFCEYGNENLGCINPLKTKRICFI